MTSEAILKELRVPSERYRAESLFRKTLVVIGIAMVILVLGVLLTLIIESVPSMKHLGLKISLGPDLGSDQ